ncbi:MAG: hypothetical protein ACRC2U_14955 [Aeromonas sp.]
MKNIILALLALIASTVFVPTDAQAQYAMFPCPNGPGPGERDLGPQPGMQGMRMCGYSGEAQPAEEPEYRIPPPKPVRWINASSAIVEHPEASYLWVVSHVRDSEGGLEMARYGALRACKEAMGDGCSVLIDGTNVFFYVTRTDQGGFYAVRAPTISEAVNVADKWCLDNNIDCTIYDHLDSTTWAEDLDDNSNSSRMALYDPSKIEGGQGRKIYGAVVWSRGATTPLADRYWFSGGHKSWQAARDAALTLCKNDLAKAGSPGECELGRAGNNGFIHVALDNLKEAHVRNGLIVGKLDKRHTEKLFMQYCQKLKRKCKIVYSFDVRESVNSAFDLAIK